MKLNFNLFKDFHVKEELRRDLSKNILGVSLGIAYFQTIGGAPFAGFIKALHVSDFQYSILMSLPILGGLFQLIAAYVLERTKARKKMFLLSGILQRVPILFAVFLPFIMPAQYKSLMIAMIGFFLIMTSIGGAFNGVSFFSWMGAVIPINIRGRFFALRQMIYTFAGFVTGIGVSSLLDRIKGFNGFAVVFLLVSILALLDISCFIKMYDPPMEASGNEFSFLETWKEAISHKNFRKYLLFWGTWIFGISIAGPFFTAYMLEYLKMSYSSIFIYSQILLTLFTMLFVRIWGNLIDRFGNKPVMYICGLGTVLLPLLWLFATPSSYFIILIINGLSGVFWCAMDLTSNNLMLGLSPDKNRSFYIANFALVTSLAGNVVGYAAGGYFMDVSREFIKNLHLSFLGYGIANYHVLFTLSGLFRLFSITVLLPFVDEKNTHSAKAVIKYSLAKLLKVVNIR